MLILFALEIIFTTHVLCDEIDSAQCQPPVILNPPDTLIGDNCNRIEHDFDADPGGIGGNGNVYWVTNLGDIDSLTGDYILEYNSPLNFTETVIAINDCSPPESTFCTFRMILENQKPVVKDKNPIRADPMVWRKSVYGPEGAESLAVLIEIEGSTDEVKTLGVKLRPMVTKNIYSARISVDQYPVILKVPNVIRITPSMKGGKPSSSDKRPLMD